MVVKGARFAQAETRRRIVEALLTLAAEEPWGEVTLAAIAERAGVTLADAARPL